MFRNVLKDRQHPVVSLRARYDAIANSHWFHQTYADESLGTQIDILDTGEAASGSSQETEVPTNEGSED